MSPITHFLMGWAVANSAPSLDKRERAMVTWASVVPDIDGLGIVADWLTRNSSHPLNLWGGYHHILAHNLCFALIVAVVAAILAKQKAKTTLLVLLSFHLHLAADLVGARGPDGGQCLAKFCRHGGFDRHRFYPSAQARFFTGGNVLLQSGFHFCPRIANAISFEECNLISRAVDCGLS